MYKQVRHFHSLNVKTNKQQHQLIQLNIALGNRLGNHVM